MRSSPSIGSKTNEAEENQNKLSGNKPISIDLTQDDVNESAQNHLLPPKTKLKESQIQ